MEQKPKENRAWCSSAPVTGYATGGFDLKYTVAEAMQDAADWSMGMTLHADSRGWRVAVMLLREEVLRLTQRVQLERNMAKAAQENATGFRDHCEKLEAEIEALNNAGKVRTVCGYTDKQRLDWLDSKCGNLKCVELMPWEDHEETVFLSFGNVRESIDAEMEKESHNIEAERRASGGKTQNKQETK